MKLWKTKSKSNGRSAPVEHESKPRWGFERRWLLVSAVATLVLGVAFPHAWSFDTVEWDTVEIFGTAFSLTSGWIEAPQDMRVADPPTTVPIVDHRYQNVIGAPSMGTGNTFHDTVSGTVQVPGIDASTFTNRGAVLPVNPLACCLPVRGFGDVDGTFYFPFTDQIDSRLKLAAIPWAGGPAAVTIIEDTISTISTLFGIYSGGYSTITFDFSDVAHIYTATFLNPTGYTESGTIAAANPAITGYHQELAGDVTWSHSCLVNVPPFTDPTQAEVRLHNLFTGTGVSEGSALITPIDLTALTGFTRTAVSTTPFLVDDVIEPVCVGGAPEPGDNDFTVFAAITRAVGPPVSKRTIDLPGMAPGTPVVGAVDNIVWGITPHPDGSRCFMCNFGELEADPFCTVITGEPFIFHANRLDDDGRRATEPSLGRIPIVFTKDLNQRSNRVGGDDGFIVHPLEGVTIEQGPAPPATEVVYGAIDVPFFFHNFESGDFRFWSSVQGQTGG